MPIVLSHASAFRFWRTFTGNVATLRPTALRHTPDARPKLTRDLRQELATLGILSDEHHPIHCLVADESLRGHTLGIRCHVARRPLPAGAVLQLSENVDIVSPELCFIQMSRVLSAGKLALAGCELCGTYATSPLGELLPRKPLTTTAQLVAFSKAVPGIAGAHRVQGALPHVLDNAASPMEAKVVLLLTLPRVSGGYGLPKPQLNPTIPLGSAAQKIYHVRTCRPDLYWADAHVDVEYDGEVHEGTDARIKDAARAAALMTEGITVMTLTYPQVIDEDAFNTVAETLAGAVGYRLRIRTASFQERRAKLRGELELARQEAYEEAN